MTIVAQERNYIPIDIDTRYHSCLRRNESNWPIKKILSFYHVKRASLYRWLNIFDGTKESLFDESHKPKSDHPNKLKAEIVKRILDLHRRNPDQSYIEIWVRMKHDGYEVSASSVLRTLKRNEEYTVYKPNPKNTTKYITHLKWCMKNGR